MIGLLILPETHLPSLQRKHRQKSQDDRIRASNLGILRTLKRSISLPTKIAAHLPVFLILVLIGIFNGLVNMILSSLGSVYQEAYHFPAKTAGLSYLGIGAGGLSSLAVTKLLKRGVTSISQRLRLSTAEASLLSITAILPISSFGLLWYGWALQSQDPWIVPILGLYMFGFGWMATRVNHSLIIHHLVMKRFPY